MLYIPQATDVAKAIFQSFANLLSEDVQLSQSKQGITLTIVQKELASGVYLISMSLSETEPKFKLDQPCYDLVVVRDDSHAVKDIYILRCLYWDNDGVPQWRPQHELPESFQAFLEYVAFDFTNPVIPYNNPYFPIENTDDTYDYDEFSMEDYL